ncbi:DUF6268 family outer membrane beta-barrel protein [Mucilaginibacter sp. UR6-1]|uniref:DUF6268 family outer membrane beta-barrel protein n=1 Tax=Mucilaginibacter sp. UR6-1 TaxID=1435643 RepID=UPI001E2C8368|nr:DUF6268 family outer membrane beta-barrel protein [Mucilaginibacter sp. UR6-1]MCC8408322.1 DUF6268 family outer membrane beta-barrel protein [Mucilaginibacter sp. UR6-1]
MFMKIRHIFILVLLFAVKDIYAQNTADAYKKRMTDSIKNFYLTEAAIRNPTLRQLTVTTDFIGGSDITSYLHGNKLLDGKLNQRRTTALFNLPLKSWGKNTITASFSMFHQRFQLNDVTTYQDNLPDFEGRVVNKFTVGFTGSFLRIDSLFGHPVVYTASVSGLTSRASSVQKMSYLGGMIFTIKQTRNMRSSVGLLLNIDPSINVPVVPLFTYWRKFNNDIELNINMPQQVSVRKTLSPNLWASFGTTLSGSIAFFRHNNPELPRDGNYSTIDLKTGPGVEYRVSKKIILGFSTGLLTNLQAREFELNQNAGDYFLRNKINPSMYFNFTVSVLPFFRL